MTYFGNRGLWRQASFRPETKALLARMSPTPSRPRQIVINRLITSLIRDGVWAKLDVLQVYAADAQANALLNWVSGSYNSTAYNSPTFTADRGFTGDGATAYLDTGYAASSGPKWGQNDHSFGRWLRSGPGGGAMDLGAYEVATLKSAYVLSNVGTQYQVSDSGTIQTVNASVIGSVTATRTASGSFDIYKNGAFVTNVVAVSRPGSTLSMYVLAYNFDGGAATFSPNQLGAVYMGAALTAGDTLALHNALQAYMTAVGA